MAIYSNSKISTFEQCPYKYKLQYIDKIKVDVPTTIEAFMGDMVHRVLEKLYSNLKFQKINTLAELKEYYNYLWDKEFSEDILIVKEEYNAQNYRDMGLKYIENYYEMYYPFNEMTILGLETQDRMKLKNGDFWHVRIDKLGFVGNTYFVVDYKTNARLKSQEEADDDRQLAMYSIWVKNKFPDAKEVILKWQMLAFGKEVVSKRSEEELEKLEQGVIDTIKKIEVETEFPRCTSALCDYCVYKSMCPSFRHNTQLEEKSSVKEFKEDDGVKLVDEYSLLVEQKKLIEEKIDEVKKEIIEFSNQKDLDIVYGSNKKISVKEYDKIIYPENIVQILKENNLYEPYSMFCSARLTSKILKGEIGENITKYVEKTKDFRLSISKKKEEE